MWGGWGGAGGAPLGRAPGWSGRAGRTSALPPPLLGAGRRAGRMGAWGPSWCWVPPRARASCLSAGSDTRWSSVPFARSASNSLVLPRSLVVAVYFLGSCSEKAVSPRAPSLHSSVLRAPRCCRGCLGRPGYRSWGLGHSRGCTPFHSAGLRPFSRRTPCLGVLCRLGCPLGFWGSPGPCRCTTWLHSLGCSILYIHILSLGCSVRCTLGVFRSLRGH